MSNLKVAVIGCGAEIVHAFSTDILLSEGKAPPAEIQWMPPGRHKITGIKDGKPVDLVMNVTEATASVAAAALREFRAKAAAGQGDLPYFDFNHDDAEASAHPTDFYWGGSDPVTGGVRCKLDWTAPGQSGVTGKAWRRFSPSFLPDNKGNVVALPLNMGGLVNRAAFRNIQPIWSRDGGSATGSNTETKTKMSEENKQLADLQTAVTGLVQTVATLGKSVETINAKLGQPDGKIVVLETKLANLEQAAVVQAKEAAKAKVQLAVKAGKIPPQDTALIEQWENLLVVDAKNGELLDKLQVNAALAGAITSGAETTATAAAGEHAFVVKAKEYAKTHNLTDALAAQTQFAGTPEGMRLYAEYVHSYRPGK